MSFNRVIIVDDNETSVFLNSDVVEEVYPNIEVISFTNSQEFLDACFGNRIWFEESTLVLLDINMPGKFGFDVLDELEEELEDLNQMKFLMVTSSTLKRDMECANRYDFMIDFLVKPLNENSLRKALTKLTF